MCYSLICLPADNLVKVMFWALHSDNQYQYISPMLQYPTQKQGSQYQGQEGMLGFSGFMRVFHGGYSVLGLECVMIDIPHLVVENKAFENSG